MIRRFSFLFAGVAIGALVTVAVTQGQFLSTGKAVAASSDAYRELNLFGDVFERVRADYVEVPDDNQLVESAINGMLAGLDPHSSYMNAKDYKDMQVTTSGKFGGLGIQVTMEDGIIKVISPMDGTPAAKAGILANDKIIALDGEQLTGVTLDAAVEKMRGDIGTPITLTIQRGTDDKKPFDVKLVRAEITVQAVMGRAEGQVIYVRISQFSEQAFDGLKANIDKLSASIGPDKVQGVIVDLRNDPGGLLDQAIAVSDAFLNEGEIVSTRGRRADETQRFNAPLRRSRQGQAGDRAGQRRLRLGLRDRRRRPAGSAPCHGYRHAFVRQGFGADHRAARQGWRAPPDHGALLHAVRPFDPGQGHRTRHRGDPGSAARPCRTVQRRAAWRS